MADPARKKRFITVPRIALAVGLCGVIIFACIFVPRLRLVINHARASKAESEIRGAEMALTKMLADADRRDFLGFFNNVEAAAGIYGGYSTMWNTTLLELLRNGSQANLDLKPEVRRKLARNYMDIGRDPWGNYYQFFAGSLTNKHYAGLPVAQYFRSYRAPKRPFYTDRNGKQQADYYYDEGERAVITKMNTYPEPDGLPGYPAPLDLPIYIWSLGLDEKSCQRVDVDPTPENVKVGPGKGLGDDINSWDFSEGWSVFYEKPSWWTRFWRTQG